MIPRVDACLKRIGHIIPVADRHSRDLDAVGILDFHVPAVDRVVCDLSRFGFRVDFKGDFLPRQDREGFVCVFFRGQCGSGFVIDIGRFRFVFRRCGVIRGIGRRCFFGITAAGAGYKRRAEQEKDEKNAKLFAHRKNLLNVRMLDAAFRI